MQVFGGINSIAKYLRWERSWHVHRRTRASVCLKRDMTGRRQQKEISEMELGTKRHGTLQPSNSFSHERESEPLKVLFVLTILK